MYKIVPTYHNGEWGTTEFIDEPAFIEYILSIYNLGFSVVDIYDNFFIFVKSSEVVNETLKYEIIKLLCKYITIFHNIHEHEIELLLFTKEIITMFHA